MADSAIPLFTATHERSIAFLGEHDTIRHIQHCLKECVPPSPQGIGDDCAVIIPPSESKMLATTDGITLGIHFTEDTLPELAGAKLLKRNLSDIAAMGGTPTQALLAIAASPDLSTEWLSRFCKGIANIAKCYQTQIVGGDVSSAQSKSFTAYITMLGSTIRPVLRNTAQIGDKIYITGTLGGSILHKHLHFDPRLPEGQWLANNADITAMIDVSDGLSKDLGAILHPESDAVIDFSCIPVSDDAHTLAKESNSSPLEHAMNDGEDYELLFTLSQNAEATAFEKSWARHFDTRLTRLGTLEKSSDNDPHIIDSNTGKPWTGGSGFQHFSN